MEEQWKSVKNYEGLYEVSTLGRVRSIGKSFLMNNHGTMCMVKIQPKILEQRYHTAGYLLVNINKHKNQKTVRVHRLVAETFLPNPENKPFVNHKNGKKDDNRLDNLEWTTPSENNKHAYISGLCKHRGRSKPVAQKDDFGNIINIFINARIASVAIGKGVESSRNIRNVCEKGYGHCGGYCWDWISWEDYDRFLLREERKEKK